MATQKFMGRHQLLARLSAQMGGEDKARALLIARGHMTPSGALTASGRARDAMTAEERAKDRASKSSKHPTSAYKYNPKTNTATLKPSR